MDNVEMFLAYYLENDYQINILSYNQTVKLLMEIFKNDKVGNKIMFVKYLEDLFCVIDSEPMQICQYL